MKRFVLLALSATLLASCGPDTPTPATFKLSLSPQSLTVTAAGTGSVTASITTSGGYSQTVTYSATPDVGLSVTQAGNVFTVNGAGSSVGNHTLTVKATGADGQVQVATAQITVQGSSALFIPAAGAPVGSGNGTKEGTVYVSPNAQEVEILNLVNEVRTKGTVNGVNVIAGSCVAANFTSLSALKYDGLLAYAARKHAEYVVNVGDEGHVETYTSSPYFYGANPSLRAQKAYLDLAGLQVAGAGEVAGSYVSAADMVRGWIADPAHCQVLMDPLNTSMGSGYTSSGQAHPFMGPNNLNIYPNNWVVDLY